MVHECSLPRGDRDEEQQLSLFEDKEKKIEQSLLREVNQTVVIVSPKACWANAELHGWHDPSADLQTDMLLIHSEISEACEGLRHGKLKMSDGPGSVEEEFADAVIRIFHTAEKNGLNIIRAVREKHRKNMDRPHRHGGKAF